MVASGTLRVGRCEMYKSFRVKNFRCFKDLQINDLGRVNLIAGKNNTGKTALMEAMYLHSGNREPKTLLRVNQSDSFRPYRDYVPADLDESTNSVVSWSNIFLDFDITNEIEVMAESDLGEPLFEGQPFQSSVTISFKSLESYDIDDILSQLRIEDFERYRNVEVLQIMSDYDRRSTYLAVLNGRVRPSRLKGKKLFDSDFLHAREQIDSRTNAHRFSNMRQSNALDKLTSALQKIEPRLQNLELLFDGSRPLIHAGIGLPKLLSLAHLGDGMNRIASLILAMSEVPAGVVFIDEIENGIHYSVQNEVWSAIGKFARDLNIQVFATTHSYEMIQAAHEAFIEDDKLDEFRYHRLDRNREGNIEAVTFSEFSIEAAMSTNWDVR